MSKRLQVYETPDITVTFDPNLCQHTGICVRGLPLVFDVKRKHWVRPELASPEDVAAQVARCPSGALQYQLHKRDLAPVPRRTGGAPPAARRRSTYSLKTSTSSVTSTMS